MAHCPANYKVSYMFFFQFGKELGLGKTVRKMFLMTASSGRELMLASKSIP
jgi:hypothetical protein